MYRQLKRTVQKFITESVEIGESLSSVAVDLSPSDPKSTVTTRPKDRNENSPENKGDNDFPYFIHEHSSSSRSFPSGPLAHSTPQRVESYDCHCPCKGTAATGVEKKTMTNNEDYYNDYNSVNGVFLYILLICTYYTECIQWPGFEYL